MNQPTANERINLMGYREMLGVREILPPPPGWELGAPPKGTPLVRERPGKAVRFRPNQQSWFL